MFLCDLDITIILAATILCSLLQDSGEICTMLGLCNSTRSMKTVVLVQQNHVSDDSLCVACKLVSNYLKNFVDSSSSESEVKEAVDELCNLLSGSAKNDVSLITFCYAAVGGATEGILLVCMCLSVHASETYCSHAVCLTELFIVTN